jgi:copper resistance protein D
VIEAALPAARAAHFAATLLIEGCVVFQFYVARGVLRGDAKDLLGSFFSRTIVIAWILAVASGIAWWLLLASQIGDSSAADALSDDTAWTLLTQTQFGWTWLARAAGFALLLTCLSQISQSQTQFIPAQVKFLNSSIENRTGFPLPRGRTGKAWRTTILVALSIALTGSLAWSGHGAATPGANGVLHLTADILHLSASGIWLGALLPFAIALVRHPDAAAALTRRFSALATACVLVLAASGIVDGWMILGGIDALTGTPYGQLLLAKIALFLLMLAFAGVNRFVLTPRLATSNSANARLRLVIHSGCEITLGLAILSLVGVLGTLTPMRQEEERHQAALTYSMVGGGSGAGPRSGRSSIATRHTMPQIATKAQAAKT